MIKSCDNCMYNVVRGWESPCCDCIDDDEWKPSEDDKDHPTVKVHLDNVEQPAHYTDGYEELREVLDRAFDQAANGKGKDRHSNGKVFTKQPIFTLGRELPDGLVFQAAKKLIEASRCKDKDRAVADLLGAIVYTAAYVILIESYED